jgi:hypothetical protein
MCLRVTTGYVQQGGAGRIVVYRVTGNPRFIAHYAVGHSLRPLGFSPLSHLVVYEDPDLLCATQHIRRRRNGRLRRSHSCLS